MENNREEHKEIDKLTKLFNENIHFYLFYKFVLFEGFFFLYGKNKNSIVFLASLTPSIIEEI
jgi:hypothetical protein